MNDLLNFRKTLQQLKKFTSMPIQNDRDKAGVIQAFEFTFEQCWKAIQKRAGHEGVEVGSPKKAFMFAFQNSWIEKSSENLWLEMLEDRNMTSHTYKEDVANEVLDHIVKKYLPAFESLLKKMES
jgi:nucleotidyltransferase substrate binding protein (TIGR01987 family)